MKAQARRAVARVVVWPPAYQVASRLPRIAPLATRAAFRTGRDGLLESSLDRISRRYPQVAPLRADLLSFQGRYEEALAAAEQASRQRRSAPATARVVRLGYRARPRPEADRMAAAGAGAFPRSPEVMWQVAVACASPEQYQRVRTAWQEQVPDLRDGLPVLRQLAVAASRAGDLAEASAWYRRAIGMLLSAGRPAPRTPATRLAGLGARTAIADLCDVLDSAGVPFFFAAGTALGLVRQGRPLGADGDIDAGIFEGDWDREALIEAFRRDPRFDVDLHPQTEKVGLRHRGGAPVDLFRFYQQDGKVWHDGVFVRWHNSPFQVVRREIGGLRVPLPEDADRYLTENYGDWRTPNPSFDAFTADAPNLEITWPEYQKVHLLRRAYDRLAARDAAGARRELGLAGETDLAELASRSL